MKLNKLMLITALAVGSTLTLSTSLQAQEVTNTPSVHSMPPGAGPGGRGRQNFEQISTRLELTDEEKPKVKAILDEQRKQIQELHADSALSPEDRRAKMKTIHEEVNTKLKAVLTPAQFTKWEKISTGHHPSPVKTDGNAQSATPPSKE